VLLFVIFSTGKVLVVGGGLTITGEFVYSSYAVVNGGLKLFDFILSIV
jgi:hypothetical protein